MRKSLAVQKVKDLLGFGWKQGVIFEDNGMKQIDNIKIFSKKLEQKFGHAERRFGLRDPGFHFISVEKRQQYSLIPFKMRMEPKADGNDGNEAQWYQIFGHVDEVQDFVDFLERNRIVADKSASWRQVFLSKINAMKRSK